MTNDRKRSVLTTNLGVCHLLLNTSRGNVIPVTEANLRDEQKQAIAKAMEDYKQQCLRSFSINRSGEVIHKEALPTPWQVTFDANHGKLQNMVDSAMNHALINQAGVLSNTVFNVVA